MGPVPFLFAKQTRLNFIKYLRRRFGGGMEIKMIEWLIGNIATIVIALAIAAVVAAVIVHLRREKKRGRSCGCGCSCDGCTACKSGDIKER